MANRVADSDTGVVTTTCDSWDDFVADLRVVEGRHIGGYLYRGHAHTDWMLSSRFERHLWWTKQGDADRNVDERFADRTDFMKREMRAFRRIVTRRQIEVPISYDADDTLWLALARQHGVDSPLLDWTRNPFVAALFAAVDAMNLRNPGFEDGELEMTMRGGGIGTPSDPFVVWALAHEADLEGDIFQFIDPIELRDPRLHAQEGLFTLLNHPVHVDLKSYLVSIGSGGLLEQFIIPGNEAFKVLGDLYRMGFTFARLFPDLDGAAKEANHGALWTMLGWAGPRESAI